MADAGRCVPVRALIDSRPIKLGRAADDQTLPRIAAGTLYCLLALSRGTGGTPTPALSASGLEIARRRHQNHSARG